MGEFMGGYPEGAENFRFESKEKEIKEVGGDWLVLNGTELNNFLETAKSNVAESSELIKEKGTYCENNGILAYVDGQGLLHAAPYTADRMSNLESAGYSKGSFLVPLSNGETPTDPGLAEKWSAMKEQSREQNDNNKVESLMEKFQAAAQEKEIKEVGGDWLTVDGIEVVNFLETQKSNIPKNTDGDSFSSDRIEAVGTYCENNGILAYVDGQGLLHAAPYTADRMSSLESAGYSKGSFLVPLSNGETPTDPGLAEKWSAMKEGSGRIA